jgi:hypothetical protein
MGREVGRSGRATGGSADVRPRRRTPGSRAISVREPLPADEAALNTPRGWVGP